MEERRGGFLASQPSTLDGDEGREGEEVSQGRGLLAR